MVHSVNNQQEDHMTTAKQQPDVCEYDGYPPENVPIDGAISLPTEAIGRRAMPMRALTKSEVPEFASRLVETMLNVTDTLTAYVMLDQSQKLLKESAEQLKEKAILAVPGKSTTVLGATVSIKSLAGKFAYDDPRLDVLEMELDALKAKIKNRKERSELGAWIDEETGEIVNAAKCLESGSTISVTPPKEARQ
jgi:hypothetical protein